MSGYHALAPALVFALIAVPGAGSAQQMAAMSDSDYIAKISTGAPPAVVKGATIVEMKSDGTMRAVQTGTNGFTCMLVDSATPMCADKNAMAWLHALVTHASPPDSVGFVYMLAGDDGASNTDPAATAPSATNHWVKTGPHVMIVGPSAKMMGYPATADPDPTKPFVMWPDTPYAHLMIPVTVQQ
jgi:hypothetical protein